MRTAENSAVSNMLIHNLTMVSLIAVVLSILNGPIKDYFLKKEEDLGKRVAEAVLRWYK
jgi:hypothetical protein